MSDKNEINVTLDDLTPQQVAMLNKIWSLDTSEQLNEFRATLPIFRRQEMDTLIEMIIMEIEGQRAEQDVSLAQRMLRELGYSC